ncbi:MAG TPA: MFS transporter [Candidatus Angelobacter sp.]|nr:MFS transporter [Candidatus Angelobacter sp.]
MHKFITMWVGQLFSQLGSALSTFALGIWVYEHTGSVSKFAAVSISWTAGLIFMSPIAGVLVDRWDRRSLLILAEVAGAARVLFFLLLLSIGKLSLFAICFASVIIGITGSIGSSAYLASMTMILPKEQLGRANGMQQCIWAFAQIVSPVLATILLAAWGLRLVLTIDLSTFLIAIGSYLLVTIPNPERTLADQTRGRLKALWDDIVLGARYVKAPSLMLLCVFLSGLNLAAGVVGVLFQPMMLAFTSPTIVGRVATIGALGMLVGSLLMSIWGGPKQRLRGIMVLNVICSLCLIAGGMKASAVVIAAAGFAFFFCYPLLAGTAQALLQQSVAPEVQGRVFSFVRLAWSWSVPTGQAVAGPIVDKLFEPWLQPNGLLAHSVGRVIGVGAGRGSGLMFIALGAPYLLMSLVVPLLPPFRSVKDLTVNSSAGGEADGPPLLPEEGNLSY